MLAIVCAAYQHVTTPYTLDYIRGMYIIFRIAMILLATLCLILGVSKYLSPGLSSMIYGDTTDTRSLWIGGALVLLACILASPQMAQWLIVIIIGA